MAKAAKHLCQQCGKYHHGFGNVCWRCERKNAVPKVCPYCHKETESRSIKYHIGCSFLVIDISRKATAKVVKAIKLGTIKAISSETKCVDCGKPARDYDHRYYGNPLDVVPVCRACNQKRGPALDVHQFYLASNAELRPPSESRSRLK